MIIGTHNTDDKVLVVAEIGNNHEGRFEVAQELVRQAAVCKVDAVKFQAIVPEELVPPEQAVRMATLKRFQLSFDQFAQLGRLAHELGLQFLVSPFALAAVDALVEHVDAFKIASGDNVFYPLLDKVAAAGKPVVISTGLLDLPGVRGLSQYMSGRMTLPAKEGLALLHCVCAYPVPAEQAGLGAIFALRTNFACTIGYSDHTLGLEAPVYAVAAGARIIEKHFTLDKHYSDYRDHQLSADSADMKVLVERIRQVETHQGPGAKIVQPCEAGNLHAARRSIAARTELAPGHVVTWSDLVWLRAAGGLPPGAENQLLGQRVVRTLKPGALVALQDVE